VSFLCCSFSESIAIMPQNSYPRLENQASLTPTL
jgi:hypothetical protein